MSDVELTTSTDFVPFEPPSATLQSIYARVPDGIVQQCEQHRRAIYGNLSNIIEHLAVVRDVLAPYGGFKQWCQEAGFNYRWAQNRLDGRKWEETRHRNMSSGVSSLPELYTSSGQSVDEGERNVPAIGSSTGRLVGETEVGDKVIPEGGASNSIPVESLEPGMVTCARAVQASERTLRHVILNLKQAQKLHPPASVQIVDVVARLHRAIDVLKTLADELPAVACENKIVIDAREPSE